MVYGRKLLRCLNGSEGFKYHTYNKDVQGSTTSVVGEDGFIIKIIDLKKGTKVAEKNENNDYMKDIYCKIFKYI